MRARYTDRRSLPQFARLMRPTRCRYCRKLDHPNIVDYIDSFLEDDTLHIVLQYCEAGDLAKLIRSKRKKGNGHFREEKIVNWFIQMTMAVDHLHGQKILHRDLKRVVGADDASLLRRRAIGTRHLCVSSQRVSLSPAASQLCALTPPPSDAGPATCSSRRPT